MTETEAVLEDSLKRQIIQDPRFVLEDPDVLQALIAAEMGRGGRNIVDLRGVLVERLEESLDQLEDTHRDVVAAAYDNLSGTNQIHRAALAMIRPAEFSEFLRALSVELPSIMTADGLHMCIEGRGTMAGQLLGPAGDFRDTVIGLPAGGVAAYCGAAMARRGDKVLLRPVTRASALIYGSKAPAMRSEAIIRLDFGPGKLAGMMAIGSFDANRFSTDKATDLLTFLGQVTDAVMQRWLG